MDNSLPTHPTMRDYWIYLTAPSNHQIRSRTQRTNDNWNTEFCPRKDQHARDICGKSCPTKKSSDFFEARLAIKSIWIQSWRERNQTKHGEIEANKRKIQKIALDRDIATVLRSLHRKRIATQKMHLIPTSAQRKQALHPSQKHVTKTLQPTTRPP
jgi:hypothetical protein